MQRIHPAPRSAGAVNPWLPQEVDEEPGAKTSSRPAPATATGPTAPQRGVPVPDQVDQLPVCRRGGRTSDLWVVGAHGGAAESTVAGLVPAWSAADHAWRPGTAAAPARSVVVARTHARGLAAAKAVAKQWASGLVPDVELLGLVLVADAPGRLPKPLRDLARLISGGYPRTWFVSWAEAWRLGAPPDPATSSRDVRSLVNDISLLTTTGATRRATTRKDHDDGTA